MPHAYTADALRDLLITLYQGFAKAACVIAPSSTAGRIVNAETGELLREGKGIHLYCAVADGSDIERFGEVLFKRAWLAGHGSIAMACSGTMLVRGPFDKIVFSPERIDYIVPAILGGGLAREAVPPVVKHPGGYLDTAGLPDLDESEEQQFRERVAAAKQIAKPASKKVKAAYIETRVSALVARGVEPQRARYTMMESCREGSAIDLYEDFVLSFQTLGEVTVGEVLDDPARFEGAALADPIEGPDYGVSTAKFFANAEGKPYIHSFAHGGIGYFLHRVNEMEMAVARLAQLPSLEYDSVRKDEAKRLSVRVGVLDSAVLSARQDPEPVLDELNKHYALAWCGTQLNVMKATEKGEWVPTDKASVRDWHSNKLIKGKVNPFDLWMRSPSRKEYEGVAFAPGCTLPPNQLNLWRGWAIDPQYGDIGPFLQLTYEAVFAGDKDLAEWALDWVAHLFQKPMELPGKAILLQAGQGVGKNTWIDTIKAPLGNSFLQVSSPKQLTGDFNAHMANKLLVHGAEAVWGGNKDRVGPLKAMITDEDQAVEYKGRDVFMVKNYKRLILSSNENWPIPMDLDDRRFAVSRCKNAFPNSFWVDYRKWLREENGAARVFGYMLDRDISAFKPWERRFSNSAWELKLRSADALTKWWYEVLVTSCSEDTFGSLSVTTDEWLTMNQQGYAISVPRVEFWRAFEHSVLSSRVLHVPDPSERKGILKKLCPQMEERQVVSKDRQRCFVFPTLNQCRENMAEAFGTTVSAMFDCP